MDILLGSTYVPEASAYPSGSALRVGSRESSKCSKEQNQYQPLSAPTQSPVRFKIRSAKERQQLLTKSSSLNYDLFEKSSRSSQNSREEMLRVHTLSPQSPNTDIIDQRRPRTFDQLSLQRKAELSTGSDMSSTEQKKTDCVGNPTTEVRGRTEWRQPFQSNRSKSLDWRALKSEVGQKNQMAVTRNTENFEGRSILHSESFDAANKPNSNELARPLKKVSLQIQTFNVTGQRKKDDNRPLSSAVSGSLPVRTVSVAQSFPFRLKTNQSQEWTEGEKSSWDYGHCGSKQDQEEHHPRPVSKGSEVTGNHTIIGRSGHNVLENNSETSSKVSLGVITPAPFVHRNGPFKRSLNDRPSFDSCGEVGTLSYKPGKYNIFPKPTIKKEQMNFTTLKDASSLLLSGKDNLVSMPTWSEEKPLSQDSKSLLTVSSIHDERRPYSAKLEDNSLDRAINKHFTAEVSHSDYGLNSATATQKSTRTEIEREVEITMGDLKQTKGKEPPPGKQPTIAKEGMIPQSKLQSPQSIILDNGKRHHQEHDLGLEFDFLGNINMKSENLSAKVREPSLDSVRSTIHKFETLALQSQSLSRIQAHRRTLSATENPKGMASVNKTYSERSLSVRSGNWNREHLRENTFYKREASDGVVSVHDLSGPFRNTTRDKDGTTAKIKSHGTKSQEPEVAQSPKLLKEFLSDQKNETKVSKMNKYTDQPDFSKGTNPKSYQKIKSSDIPDEKVRNYISPTMSHNSQKSRELTNKVHSDHKDFFSKSKNPVLKSTKDEVFLPSGNPPRLPNSGPSTTVKPTELTGNHAHFKSPFTLFHDSEVMSPIDLFPSGLDNLGNPYNTLKDEKVAAKVIRWIMHKGVDDEDDDDFDEDEEGTERGYDSDSGESSITVTSNMSSRSFSMRLVELCSLGGLDLPHSDASGSKDDENWMSKRTVSISSDVSALSSVTLLGMDELDCLLNEVKSLDEEAIEKCEDVHVVVLHKDPGCGLGFTVAGGVDQNKPVTVHKVLRSGIAAQEGSIHVGDQVLSINGTALHNSTHNEALSTMKKARGRNLAVVVIKQNDVTETSYSITDNTQRASGNLGSKVRVILNKSNSDLGFSLEGGVGSSLGDKPLTVQRLFQGGPVGKVYPGDELLEIEGQSLKSLRRLEVWHLIKRLPPGPVAVLLQRSHHRC